MANNMTVDEVIGSAAYAQVMRMATDLDALADKIVTVNQAARTAGAGMGNAQNTRQAVAATTDLERAQKKLLDLQSSSARELARVKEQSRQLSLQLRAEAQEMNNAGGSLNKLRAQLILAQRDYDAMSEAIRNTDQGSAAKKRLDDLTASVKKLEEGTGRHTRNVGNYKSAFDGLGVSLTGLLREVPSVQSVNQLFLAWSNQLPQFFEEIDKAKEGVKAFKEETLAAVEAQKLAAEAQMTASQLADKAEAAFADQTDSVVDSIAAAADQAAALKEQILAQVESAEAGAISTAEAAANTEALLINAGATAEDAAAVAASTVATIEANIARGQATVALETQTVAVAENTAAQAANASVGARLLKTLFSTQTLILGGILILTTFGKEILKVVGDLIQFTSEAERNAEAIKKATAEVYQEAAKSIANVRAEVSRVTVAFEEARKGVISKKEALAIYNNTLGDTLGTATSYNQAEQIFIDKTPDYLKFVYQRAVAQVAFQKAAEKSVEALFATQKAVDEAGESPVSTYFRGVFNGGAGFNTLQMGIAAARKEGEKNTVTLNAQSAALQKVAADAQLAADQLGKALGVDITGTKPTKPKKEKQPNEDGSSEAQKFVDDLRTQLEELRLLSIQWNQIRESLTNIDPNSATMGGGNAFGATATALSQQLLGVQEDYNASLLDIEVRYSQGGFATLKEYEEAKLRLEQQTAVRRQQLSVNAYRGLLDNETLTGEERQQVQAKLGEAELALQQAINSSRVKNDTLTEEQIRKNKQETAELSKQLGQETLNTLNSIADASTRRQVEELGKQSTALDQRYELERIKIENSLLTQEERQKQLLGLESSTQAERNRLAAEQEQLEKEQANRRKTLALFTIAINTATAVSEQLKQPGGLVANAAQIEAIIAIGIAQAVAASIAQYAEGTDNHPGGPAIMGEQGREIVLEPGGKAWMTAGRATLYQNLAKGAQVIPHDEVLRMASLSARYGLPNLQMMAQDNGKMDKLIAATQQQTAELKKAMRDNRAIFPASAYQYSPGYLRDVYN